MEITYLGHSCFLLKIRNTKILFDPFITPNPLAKKINISGIKADYILLSHGHQDHVADVEAIYHNTSSTIIANFEVVHWYQKKGLEKVHPMNYGGQWKFDFGTVKMVNAVHSSSMPDGTYGGNPAGFVIQSKEKAFYYAGDTALHQDMKQIGEYDTIDFAFLPIGDNFTMDIQEALEAAKYVKTQKIIGMHYDTFPHIEIDHTAIRKLAQDQGKELILMEIGQSIEI